MTTQKVQNLNKNLCHGIIRDDYGRKIQCQNPPLPNADLCEQHYQMEQDVKKILQAHPPTSEQEQNIRRKAASWRAHFEEQRNKDHDEGVHFCKICNYEFDEGDPMFYCERCGLEHDVCEECAGKVHGYPEKLCSECEKELGLLEKSCYKCQEYFDEDPHFFVQCKKCGIIICHDCLDEQDAQTLPNPDWVCTTCRQNIVILDESEKMEY